MNRTQSKNQEYRSINLAVQNVAIRSGKNGSNFLEGKAVVYNSLSEDLGGFREKISPGAFTRSLKTIEVMAYYAHDDARILGRESSGTLTITDKSDALYFRVELPNTSDGQMVEELARRGDLKNMSFGFAVDGEDGQDWQQVGGQIVRTVTRALLFEVSVVGTPAYTASTAALASRNAPAAIREALRADNATDDDGDIVANSCDCRCIRCIGTGDDDGCESCIGDENGECDLETCSGCPLQAENNRSAHLVSLLNRRRILLED